MTKREKNKSGAAVRYVSRNQAIKRLQISLKDFRRLCILKGIYPVEPKNRKKINNGSSALKTYYYAKDISFLSHEPLLEKFREFKIFLRKFHRALSRREYSVAERLKTTLKPSYKLDHIIRERYPSFTDAVRDIDDALCLVFLFAALPKGGAVRQECIEQCQRLSKEWMYYVSKGHALRKVFLSIKGIYYQAEVHNQIVTWITPYRFAQTVPEDVDMRVMTTFVDFYITLMGFVNFKLFSDINLSYPPSLDAVKDGFGAGLNSLHADNRNAKKSIDTAASLNTVNDKASKDRLVSLSSKMHDILKKDASAIDQTKPEATLGLPIDRFEEVNAPTLSDDIEGDVPSIFPSTAAENENIYDRMLLVEQNKAKYGALFHGCVFFLNREVPRDALEFVIRAFGGQVGWEEPFAASAEVDRPSTSSFSVDDSRITHHVIDRPVTSETRHYLSRVYVQPQFVIDCVNALTLLDVLKYAPGVELPPHLSPFVSAERQATLEDEESEATKKRVRFADIEDESESETVEESRTQSTRKSKQRSTGEKRFRDELDAEKEGMPFAEFERQQKKKPASKHNADSHATDQDADEHKKMRMMMMSKKDRRLYQRIQHGKKKQQAETDRLQQRRQQLARDKVNKSKK